jgi:hypothetical protein
MTAYQLSMMLVFEYFFVITGSPSVINVEIAGSWQKLASVQISYYQEHYLLGYDAV